MSPPGLVHHAIPTDTVTAMHITAVCLVRYRADAMPPHWPPAPLIQLHCPLKTGLDLQCRSSTPGATRAPAACGCAVVGHAAPQQHAGAFSRRGRNEPQGVETPWIEGGALGVLSARHAAPGKKMDSWPEYGHWRVIPASIRSDIASATSPLAHPESLAVDFGRHCVDRAASQSEAPALCGRAQSMMSTVLLTLSCTTVSLRRVIF